MAKPTNPKPYKKVERVDVYIWGRFAGAVALDPILNHYVFAYDPQFARSGIELSPIHMPLGRSDHLYVFTDLPERTYWRMPALLADALPDRFGNALIDEYMARQGIAKSQITPLDRLAYMGKRAMGALEFRPARGPMKQKPTALVLSQLVDEARQAVGGTTRDNHQTKAALRNLIDVGTSAGGARAKAVIAWNPQTLEIRSGQVDADPGFEHWLLKFDGMNDDKTLGTSQTFGRIEYAYSEMAKAAGIQMTACALLEEHGRAHFITKRFDREQGHVKHHTQTLCAMSHLDFNQTGTHGYEQLFLTIRELSLGYEAEAEAFRRMAFNVMARNQDDHTKNISFILRHGGNWELAPAYDVTFACNPQSEWTNQHQMSVNGKFADITTEDLLTVAERFGIGEGKSLLSDVRLAILDWPRFAKQAGLNSEYARQIQHQLLLLA